MPSGIVTIQAYFQEIVVREEEEAHTYTTNPAGKTLPEREVTRPVRVRHIRKNVLVKELPEQHPVVHPRSSWLEKHSPEEIDTLWKKRDPFTMRTRGGKIITVTPTEKKRIRKLKKKKPERTVIKLYASQHEQDPGDKLANTSKRMVAKGGHTCCGALNRPIPPLLTHLKKLES